MTAWIGNLIVVLAILASAGYAALNLGPHTWGERWRAAVSRHFPALRRFLSPGAGTPGCPSCNACKAMTQRRP